MNHWTEFCGYLPTGDCSTDNRGDTPTSSVSSLSSLAAAAAEMTSSCFSDVTSRSAGAHVGSQARSGGDTGRKPASGLKKCFHCPHCRYSTDRKNNLKRHLGTMHRDHYGSRVMELDQSTYHVSVQRRTPCQSCIENFDLGRRSFGKRHIASVLLDDFARTDGVSATQTDDVNSVGVSQKLPLLIVRKRDDADHGNAGTRPPPPSSITTRNDDVTRNHVAGTRPLSLSSTALSDDVSNDKTEAGAQPLAPRSTTTRNDDVTIRQTTQNGDVSRDCDSRPLPPSHINDSRNSLPRFEPRPGTAYRRHSSRMFFYDRLRSTHDYSNSRDPS